jgi:hypothetical protein
VSLHKIKRVSPKGNPFFIENKAEICDMTLALFLGLTKNNKKFRRSAFLIRKLTTNYSE